MTGTHLDATGADGAVASDRRSRLAAATFGPLRAADPHRPRAGGSHRRADRRRHAAVPGADAASPVECAVGRGRGDLHLPGAQPRPGRHCSRATRDTCTSCPGSPPSWRCCFPLSVVPVAVTIMAALHHVADGLRVLRLHGDPPRLRAAPLRAPGSSASCCPIMGGEVVNNLANLHWYLLIAAFCAILVPSRSYPFAVLQGVAVFAAVTSDALALLLLPFLVYRWWVYRCAARQDPDARVPDRGGAADRGGRVADADRGAPDRQRPPDAPWSS